MLMVLTVCLICSYGKTKVLLKRDKDTNGIQIQIQMNTNTDTNTNNGIQIQIQMGLVKCLKSRAKIQE